MSTSEDNLQRVFQLAAEATTPKVSKERKILNTMNQAATEYVRKKQLQEQAKTLTHQYYITKIQPMITDNSITITYANKILQDFYNQALQGKKVNIYQTPSIPITSSTKHVRNKY